MTESISSRVIAELRALRQRQKVSARVLADRMTAAGFPIDRGVIANAENGRRTEISVGHLVAAAQALGADAAAVLRRCAPCPTCQGARPAGFTCNTCGGTS
ncbi:helix-turn-helix domain-containing protein [Streptomyces monashensis]|uniref:helix-turn-helix domain-containing protein n=1 Tax=Streptomyces monashensis TaxID=1678012 RepID=UPI0033F879C9